MLLDSFIWFCSEDIFKRTIEKNDIINLLTHNVNINTLGWQKLSFKILKVTLAWKFENQIKIYLTDNNSKNVS